MDDNEIDEELNLENDVELNLAEDEIDNE